MKRRKVRREDSTILPSVLILTLILGFLQFKLPRNFALLPLLVAVFYMTTGQALVIGGVDLYLTRILILLGLVRIALTGKLSSLKWNSFDSVVFAWLLVSSFLYILFDGTNVAVSERLGYVYDVAGTYLLARWSVRSIDDIVLVVKMCAVMAIPLAVLLAFESITGRNVFAGLGGVPTLSEVRDGGVRSAGPFPHPIHTGTFGATAFPLFIGLYIYSKDKWVRLLTMAAVAAGTVIVLCSGSSGPAIAYVAAFLALCCWPLRNYMRLIRWGIGMAFVALIAVMNAPVWFIIFKLSDFTGGGGWYRSELIDAAIRHLDEWWLIGTGYTAHWMPTGISADANSADIVNEFVAQGVHGGMLALLLFIWMIVKSFRAVGDGVRRTFADSPRSAFLIWTIGGALLAHISSFFSVSYFGQIIVYWIVLIGIIATLAHRVHEGQVVGNVPPAPTERKSSRGKRGLASSYAQFRRSPIRKG